MKKRSNKEPLRNHDRYPQGYFMRYFLPADPPSAPPSLSDFPVAPCKSTNQDALHPEIFGICFRPVRST